MRDLTNGICGILCRGAGSRLHGNMKVSAHLRFFLSNFFAEYQSREHATKTLQARGPDVPCARGSSGTAI